MYSLRDPWNYPEDEILLKPTKSTHAIDAQAPQSNNIEDKLCS